MRRLPAPRQPLPRYARSERPSVPEYLSSVDGEPGRRLLYICDWLPPDFGAVGQYSVIFARELAADGFDVTLAGLSTRGDSDTTIEIGRGRLREIKLPTKAYDNKAATARRLLWTIWVNTRLVVRLWGVMRNVDTILFTWQPASVPALDRAGQPRAPQRARLPHNGLPPGVRHRSTGKCRALSQRALSAHLVLAPTRLSVRGARRGSDRAPRRDRDRARSDLAEARSFANRDFSRHTTIGPTRRLSRQVAAALFGNWGFAHDVTTFVEGYRRHHAEGSGRFVLWLDAVGANAARVASALTEAAVAAHPQRPGAAR